MDNPEKLSIKNGQSRETGNIWYTKLETQTNKAKKQKQDSTLYVLDTTILYIISLDCQFLVWLTIQFSLKFIENTEGQLKPANS
jgi:hypothetical protein